jgi:uncharacterized protein Yka (UPF0111/DUF47 family)
MPEAENLNPVGLALTQFITNVFTPIIKTMVAEALAAQADGRTAATLLDDELDTRVKGIVEEYLVEHLPDQLDEDRVRELIDRRVGDHESDYDHDKFVDRDDLLEKIDDALNDKAFTPVDADDIDFCDAVRKVIRDNI